MQFWYRTVPVHQWKAPLETAENTQSLMNCIWDLGWGGGGGCLAKWPLPTSQTVFDRSHRALGSSWTRIRLLKSIFRIRIGYIMTAQTQRNKQEHKRKISSI